METTRQEIKEQRSATSSTVSRGSRAVATDRVLEISAQDHLQLFRFSSFSVLRQLIGIDGWSPALCRAAEIQLSASYTAILGDFRAMRELLATLPCIALWRNQAPSHLTRRPPKTSDLPLQVFLIFLQTEVALRHRNNNSSIPPTMAPDLSVFDSSSKDNQV